MEFLNELEKIIQNRKSNPTDESYTSKLFKDGVDRILKKVGEEAGEVIIAAKNPSNSELVHEVADLLFHTTVLLVDRGISLKEIEAELVKRHKK